MDPEAAQSSDILVIGGGPAGTTAAALLREKGWSVTLADKDRHPRFHIGESLLPRNMPILRRLGVMDELQRIGVVKRGADFNLPCGSRRMLFDFSTAKAPDEPTAFQVRRSEFDHMLLRNARAKGVCVHEETTIAEVVFPPDGGVSATAVGPDGSTKRFSARFLIDASGRSTFMSSRLGLKARNPHHNSAAVFGHFAGVPRNPGEEAGNISIYWFEHGWFWLIPLANDVMSVGMVVWPKYLKSRKSELGEFFQQGVAQCPPVAARLAASTPLSEITATGNFSYASAAMSGERYVMVGDAYAFVDPVFSSGVYLAMQGGSFAADAIDGCLREPHRAKAHMRRFERQVRRGIRTFSWFIYRFTAPAMQELFMNAERGAKIRRAVVSVLSGDVYGRTRIFWELLAFKAMFYAITLRRWRDSLAFRRRFQE